MYKKARKNRKKLILGIFVAVLLLIGGAGTAIWLIVSNNSGSSETEVAQETEQMAQAQAQAQMQETQQSTASSALSTTATNHYNSSNCTTAWGSLMLINPNFTVDTSFISQRQQELVNITNLYGITEGNSGNGVPLMDAEAAQHLNDMINAYKAAYPGHTMTTRSCFRARGTTCGRLCVATGGSDHHSGYTCDLVDDTYGDTLDPDLLSQHPDWQWLYQNSYKYGFIDRFPEEWAGSSMAEPAVINAEGSTGLFETWHYRYVGITAATEIATGKYNNGKYDSLEHYLKATGAISNLVNMSATCNK